MSSKWTYEIGYGYESILRDGVMVNKEQAVRALNNYESRIAELEGELDRRIRMPKDLWFQVAELSTRVNELKAAQRWIPVSERLPEDGETVFVIIHDGFERFENGNEVARLTYLGNGNWWSWGRERYVVTHWMPLPNPPEVQE